MTEGEFYAKFKKCASCHWCLRLSDEGYRECAWQEDIAPVKSICGDYQRDEKCKTKVDTSGEYIGSDTEGYISGIKEYGVPVQTSSGGCYVATALYGSYDCPEVWTLRRYRDDTLAKSFPGRCFIRAYYAISPTAVKLFGKRKWFSVIFRKRLDRMVKKLNDKGVLSTPYIDKDWRKK